MTGSTPALARTREELEGLLAPARRSGARVALVPTMGALHAGHASLVRTARGRVPDGPVAVSIFVNPLQFGEGEDLDRYPRTLEDDLRVCAAEGVDVVFAPSVEEVYPGGEPQVTLDPGPLGRVLEGRIRPGHFRGVLTVVAKLFGLVRPDVAVFGQKDYQQLALVRRMALDLNLGVEIVGAETEREPDGLALSSRNRFLDAEAREQARTLVATLWAAQEGAAYGKDGALGSARAELRRSTGVDLDYLEITDVDLGPLPAEPAPGTEGRVLIAARVGGTRLIDNLPLTFGSPPAARGAHPTALHPTALHPTALHPTEPSDGVS
jgi:pantoate--beta-alanine ligase